MAVKKANTVLDYRERWWPNPRTQCDAEEVTKSQKPGRPGSTTYICVVLDPFCGLGLITYKVRLVANYPLM